MNVETGSILGASAAITALRGQIRRLAAFDTLGSAHVPTVLLRGETGTGKGLVARAMHASGARRTGSFVDVSCGAIPEGMLEAELFGFEAGAFTDARRAKPGLFEAASGGTLFLDEIDALTPPLQSKLLKAIEEKSIRRLGAVTARQVDAKLIAATQANLEALVAAGRFRADLYHRLAVFILVLPPLRERPADIELLAEHYLTTFASAHGLTVRRLGESALRWLRAHPWPGNVRELGHLMERVALLAPEGEVDGALLAELAVPHVVAPAPGMQVPDPSRVETAHIDSSASTAAGAPSAGAAATPTDGVAAAPREGGDAARIRETLALTGGNVVAAARILGIGRNALRYRMRRLGIARPELGLGPEELGPGPSARASARPGALRSAEAPHAHARSAVNEQKHDELRARRGREGGPAAIEPQSGPTWEQKTAVALGCEITFLSGSAAGGASSYEPWTVTMRWQQAIAEKLTGFGGTIIDRSPGRVLAIFGAPRALERAAERAVQASLAIRSLPGVRPGAAHGAGAAPSRVEPDASAVVEVRMAAHIGTVQVDTSAPPESLRERVLAVGDALSLPQRLLGHAGSGEILLSPTLARRVEGLYELRARDLQVGASTSDRLVGHSVVRVASPASRAAVRTCAAAERAEFVGREHEVGLLERAFARARSGRGQVALVAGDAGIGKSRLLVEFGSRIAQEPHFWIEGRCTAYGGASAFLPVADGLRRAFAIDDRDDEAGAAAKVTERIRALGSELEWTIPLVHHVLSIAADERVEQLDSARRRSEVFRALLELMRGVARRQPLVLVVEDLHWIDPASEELLAFLADAVPGAPLLLIGSFRTGYRPPFGDRSYQVRITLGPLSSEEVATINGSLLGVEDVPEGLRALIARKAEGNPFFVEELTKALLEDGTLECTDGRVRLARSLAEVETSVPDTIHELLSARLDRLAADARRAIQIASVIGREFALRLLERISEVGEQVRLQVEELRALELIYEKALHPELAYMFKHALTHEVAYRSVVAERRRDLHRTIGAAIEALYADRLAEHYESLAHHFGHAEDWERALDYHDRAAQKAAARFANQAVVQHCRQALEMLDRVEHRPAGERTLRRDLRLRLEERLALALFYLSDFVPAAEAYERAARVSEDTEQGALLLATAAFAYVWGHRYDDSRRANAEARTRAGSGDLSGGEAACLVVDGFHCGVLGGDVAGEARLARRAMALAAASGHEEVEALASSALARTAEWIGDYAGASAAAERTIEIARRKQRSDLIVWATWFLGKARCCSGDFGMAIAELREAYDLCDRLGDRAWRARLLNTLGWCFAEVGSSERAREYNLRASALAREIGDPELISNSEINLSANALALGETDAALGHLEPIEAMLRVPGDPWMRWRYALHARDVRARIELAARAPERALLLVDEEIAGARRHEAPKVEARALVLRGETLALLERREEAGDALRAAAAIAERIGYSRAAWEAHGDLATLLERGGRAEDALPHAARQRSLLEHAAASLRDAEIGRGLLRAVKLAR